MQGKKLEFFCHFGDCKFKAETFDEVVTHRLQIHNLVRVENPTKEWSTPTYIYVDGEEE